MKHEDISAEKLCELADEYQLSADEIVKNCLENAKNTAQYSGQKAASSVFNSKAVSDQELEAVKSRLEDRGFIVKTSRRGDYVSVELNFDVCD